MKGTEDLENQFTGVSSSENNRIFNPYAAGTQVNHTIMANGRTRPKPSRSRTLIL